MNTRHKSHHKPKPCPSGNRHQRERRFADLARSGQSFTERESVARCKAERIQQGA